MFPGLLRLPLTAVSLSLLVPAAAVAAPVTKSGTGTIAVLNPLSVLKRGDLDFGTLVVSGTGTAVLDPSGTLTTSGGVLTSGTGAHAATFTGTGSKNSIVHVKLPTA